MNLVGKRQHTQSLHANCTGSKSSLAHASNLLLQMSGIKEKDLAFVRFVGGAHSQHCLPYFIAVDHATNSVGEPKCMIACLLLLLLVGAVANFQSPCDCCFMLLVL